MEYRTRDRKELAENIKESATTKRREAGVQAGAKTERSIASTFLLPSMGTMVLERRRSNGVETGDDSCNWSESRRKEEKVKKLKLLITEKMEYRSKSQPDELAMRLRAFVMTLLENAGRLVGAKV